jgi:serine/threonine-protein kinase
MRSVLFVLLGIAGAFVLGVLIFNFVVMPRLVQHEVTVRVPEIVGLDVSEARQRCLQIGLDLDIRDRLYSEGVPSDRVLSQSPEAGTEVKRGRRLNVKVSMGTEQVRVPDVRGMTLRQASLQLDNVGLGVGRVSRVYEGHGGQIVQATRPRSGTLAASGQRVDVLVAVGGSEEPFLMPNLVGRSLEDVRALVEERGFRVGRVTYRSHRGVYPGTVLEHHPTPGSLIQRGEMIELVASTPE